MNKRIFILFSLITIPSLFFAPNAFSDAKKKNIMEAKLVLTNYLEAISLGQFDKCNLFISNNLSNNFKKDYIVDCEHYLRTSEEFYRVPKIVEEKIIDGKYIYKVSMGIDGPGYKECATLSYYMTFENAAWKIDDWKFETKKEIPISKDSAIICK